MHKLRRIGTWFVWLSLTSFAAIAGCGDDDHGGETLIGVPCEKSSECDVTGSCVTSGKDGLCTMPCDAPGAAGQCPLGSYCDRREVEVDGDEASAMTLCFPSCENQDDCRDGYECDEVVAGHGMVCIVEE
jgi:hypothetical protein